MISEAALVLFAVIIRTWLFVKVCNSYSFARCVVSDTDARMKKKKDVEVEKIHVRLGLKEVEEKQRKGGIRDG